MIDCNLKKKLFILLFVFILGLISVFVCRFAYFKYNGIIPISSRDLKETNKLIDEYYPGVILNRASIKIRHSVEDYDDFYEYVVDLDFSKELLEIEGYKYGDVDLEDFLFYVIEDKMNKDIYGFDFNITVDGEEIPREFFDL